MENASTDGLVSGEYDYRSCSVPVSAGHHRGDEGGEWDLRELNC
jgi:hypothetical protein